MRSTDLYRRTILGSLIAGVIVVQPVNVSPSPAPAMAPAELPGPSLIAPAPVPDDIPVPPEPRRRVPRFPLAPGSHGAEVKLLQRTLAGLTYDPGSFDGRFGSMTQHAVFAFEKVEGLELDGIVDRKEMRRILHADPPLAPERETDDFVDIDIGTQVLLEVQDGRVVHTLPISSANGEYYYSRSGLAVASTPRGSFEIYSKHYGWRISYLGGLYYPSYFYGGYAIHGSTSVPPYPASHGCIRIPMHSAVAFFERNPVGTPVFVHD